MTLDDWCKFFLRHKIDLRGFCPRWSVFAECFQRRHVLVHNGGKVSKLYLQRVDADWLAEHTEVCLGAPLSIKAEYLQDALDYFEIAGILLCLECWQCFAPKDRDSRTSRFAQVQYDCLLQKRWFVAEALGSWATSKGDLRQDQLLIARFNLWLGIKRQGRWAEIEQEVASFDHSALAPMYVVGIHALTDNLDALFSILPNAGLSQSHLREWPILDEARNDARFDSLLT